MKPEWITRAIAQWQKLAPRERRRATGAGIILLLVFAYAGLWLPFQRDLARLRQLVPAESERLVWMRTQAAQVGALRARVPLAQSPGDLPAFVERSATAYGIRAHITRLEPDGATAIRLTVANIGFNDLVRWLDELQQQGGLRVEQAGIEAQPAPGVVEASLLLRTASR